VISPLKALAEDQSKKLSTFKPPISSIALSFETEFTLELIQQLIRGDYNAIFMSPELIFSSRRLTKLWHNPRWIKGLLVVVIDEAHCIEEWGAKFRPDYSRLGEIRSHVGNKVAFVVMSATLLKEDIQAIKQKLCFRDQKTKVFNLGNDTPNIKYIVRLFKPQKVMLGAGIDFPPKDGLNNLEFLLDDDKKTIVYFNKLETAEDACDYLKKVVFRRKKLSDGKTNHLNQSTTTDSVSSLSKTEILDASKIEVYHSFKSKMHKETVMDDFLSGRISILLASEAVGMGCDIPDVIRVVQFGMPNSLSQLIQRLGRAARDPSLQGYGYLIIHHRSIMVNTNNKVDKLFDFIETTDCRRRISNETFGSEHFTITQ